MVSGLREDYSKWVWHLEVNVLIVFCACMSLDTDIWGTNVLISVPLKTTVALEVIHHIAAMLEWLI